MFTGVQVSNEAPDTSSLDESQQLGLPILQTLIYIEV